ncbi:MAG: type VI secretion system ATPase TssH, partial [Clostridiales Family XIII bacterium]|nr:type VI secretion system ATPase TssH [Clostridiales Family XIII bacterium]
MNFEKFTQKAQQAVSESQQVAVQLGHQQLDGEHIHLALLLQEEGIVPKILRLMGVDVQSLVRDIEGELERLPKVQAQGSGDSLYPTRRIGKLLGDAEKIAKGFHDDFISVEHLYLALIDESGTP